MWLSEPFLCLNQSFSYIRFMKNLFYFSLFAALFLSCQDEAKVDDTSSGEPNVESEMVVENESEDDKILLTALPEDNPTKGHFEALLNSFYEDFEEVMFIDDDLESTELVYGFTQLRTVESKTTVKFFFADYQNDLIDFGESNFQEGYWGVNGGGLFVVSGEDEQVMNDVLSWFNGEE